jgi:hypothetical protein
MAAPKSSQSRARSRPLRPSGPAPAERESASGANPGLNRAPEKDVAAVAEYIATMTAELAAMAGAARLDMLTYFLNMARLEAEFHQRRSE